VGAIQARLGISDGELAAWDPNAADAGEMPEIPDAIGNIGYLAL